MKLRLPHLLRRLLIATMTVTGVTVGTSNSYGAIMNSDVPLSTYTDFGQNMGWYKTEADANALLTWIRKQQGGVTIAYTGGQEPYTLEHEMINFTGVSDNGAFMSLGYNATTSVEHNGVFGGSFTSSYIGADNSVFYQGIEYRLDGSETFIHSPQGGWDKGGFDHKVTRMSKVITDVQTATLFSGTSAEMRTYVVGEQLYHTGAGTMKMYDTETGTINGLTGAYAYIVGGIETIDGAWAGGKDNDGDKIGDYDVISTVFNTEGHESVTTYEPLPYAGQQGDSGSPVFVYNSNTGQYEYVAAVQSIAGGYSTHYYGGIDYVRSTLSSYDKLVQSAAGHATLHIGAVTTQGDTLSADNVAYNYGQDATVSTTKWLGTVTGGAADVSFVGVKSGINTWLDLSAVKDTDNWFNYENTYLNAAPYLTGANATAGKQLTYADLFVTENLVFAAGTATTDIILDATVDLGIGYAQFSLGGTEANPITSATFNISSGGDGSYQFNHAGYVIDAGVDVHTTLTGSADHMYEWRKVGAGNLHIEGTGNNNILLNVGGAGKTYLNRTAAAGESSAYAAYNVLANTYATVVIADINQIARDFTFGHQGGVLDMNGNSMVWNNSNTDVSAVGFTIHALDEQAIVANLKSASTTTLTWTQSGAQTFLGSFADNGKDSALQFIYNGGEGASLALHSIKTSLTAPGSGMVVQSGTLSLSGTNTVHGTGSESGKNANRYHSDLDWHYADATSDVTVQNGGTFELGSHARLTGDITVEQGGTFLMREGVQHAQEYVEGSTKLMSTDDVSAFFGLKGNVSLASGATMWVEYGSGVTANNTYSGNITGSGNVEIDLGSADARFTLAGKNTFSGTKKLDEGLLIGDNVAALGNVGESGWLIGSAGTLQVASGLTAANALGLVHADSTGTLSLTEDMGALNMSGHTGLFIGAAEGQTIQYGTAEESISPAGGKYNLGGGGGELVVNAALTGSGNLVLGNGQGLGGIVTLTNASNSIGSITFNPGVTLSFADTSALGGANITLVYGSSLLGSSDSVALLNLIQSGSQGAILLDRADNANFDMSNDGGVALSASGNVTYSGTVTVAEGGTYRFGGGSGTLTLTQALAANGSNGLVIDGQNSSGGKVILGAASGITGQVKVQGYQANTTPALGDITLGFTVDNALASASGVIVARGGVIDVGSTTQTLNNVQISVGGLLKGNSDGTLIFNMTGSGQPQYGAMQLGKAEKIGTGELCLTNTNYSWELLTITEGTVSTQVDNALSATGTTRVEGSGVLNMNTKNGGRTMHGNVELAKGGTLSAGAGNDYAITFNGTISAAEGSTGTITNGSSWILNSAENNIGGGTLVFNAPRLELNQTIDQHIGGTLDIGANSVTLYSGGAGEDMLKHLSHVNVSSGKTLHLSELTWNTIWQIDQLTGSGTINWYSTTTHDKTARVILSGDGGFSGTINMLRRYNQSNRTHQAFIEINGENAVSGATLNFAGTGASSYASLAINADNVNIGGLQSNVSLSDTNKGTDWAHIFAGAAPELSASTTATASSRKATLTITGSGDYTYGGHVGSTADTKEHSLNITMNGSGTQSFEGGTIVVGDLTAKSGTLRVQNMAGIPFQVLGDVNMYQGGTLTVSLDSGADEFGVYADLTLGSGQSFNVLDVADSAATATFNGNLVLNGGILRYDGAALSATDANGAGTAALTLSSISFSGSTQTIHFTNYDQLKEGSSYILATGDWTSLVSNVTASGLEYYDASFTTNSSGHLVMTLALKQDYLRWDGDETKADWGGMTCGSTSYEWGYVTGKPVIFDDSAEVTNVRLTNSASPSKVTFNASKDYYVYRDSGYSYTQTAGELVQEGTGTTTLQAGVMKVTTTTTIKNGVLEVQDNATLGGAGNTISGDGTLRVNLANASDEASFNIAQLGTLHLQQGTYAMNANANNDDITAISRVQIDENGTLKLGTNATLVADVASQGTISMHAGELKGTLTLTGDTTIHSHTGSEAKMSAAINAQGHKLTLTGGYGLLIDNTDTQLSELAIQSGYVAMHSDFTAEKITAAAGTTVKASNAQMVTGVKTIELNGDSISGASYLTLDYSSGMSGVNILLNDHSEIQVFNGGGGYNTLNADIVVKSSQSVDFNDKVVTLNPVIRGGYNGGNSVVSGSITAANNTTLQLTNNDANPWTIASSIADGENAVLGLNLLQGSAANLNVRLSGKNTYTGGTTINSNTTLHAVSSSALGSGNVQMNGGTLRLERDLSVTTLNGSGTLDFNKRKLTVGADHADATYSGSFSGEGGIIKTGSNTQTFSNATVKVDDVSVQGGTLAFTHADAPIVGNISVTGDGVLNMEGTYTLNQGNTLSVLSNKQSTLGGLTLNGGVMALLFDDSATAETVALTVEDEVQDGSMTILLNGVMPTKEGEYLLLGGNFANVSAGGVSVAVQESAMQTFALARSGEEEAPNLISSVRTTEKGLYLVLSENPDSYIWAGDADNNTWSKAAFSVYGTSMVDGADETARFDNTATNKSVNVSEAVSVGNMEISGGGYSFGGDGSISLSGQLSVTDGGEASVIEQIYIPNGPIRVDGSELTIIELTPANPSAPIELSHAAKLTIGSDSEDEDYRYGAFSGKVTGDAGSQLHLYTTQVDGNYWGTDGTIQLLEGSTLQDIYVHGDLALNIIDSKQGEIGDKFTHVQGANLHMDAGSQLVVRAEEGSALTPTTGNIVLHGDLNIVAYEHVTTGTAIASNFVLANDESGTLIKKKTTNGDGTDSTGSITLSGDINVSGITVESGTLKLTGSSITAPSLSVTGGSLVVDNAAGTLSATGGLNLAANTAADITANTIHFGDTGKTSITMAAGATATINGQSVTTGHVEIVNGATLTLQGDSYTFKGKIGAANNADSLIIFQGSAFATDVNGRNLNGTFRLESDAAITGGYVHVTPNATLQVNAGKTLHLTGGNLELQSNAKLVLQSDSQIIIDSGRTLTMLGDIGTEGIASTITLAGGSLQLNLGTANATQTVYSAIEVNKADATAEAPATSIIRNNHGAESMYRTLSSVTIAANNTLELQQASWNTIWNINSLSGEGDLTWKSSTQHSTTSRLILGGDNDFSGTIKLNRTGVNVTWHNGNYQAYLVLSSDTAAKSATVSLEGATNQMYATLVVNTSNAQVAGLSGNANAHMYSGDVATSSTNTVPASTANNTLTIAGGGTYAFAGTVGTADETAHLNLAMTGSGSQTFSGVAHVGDVSVSNGTLVLSNASSVVHGDISVSGGKAKFVQSTLGAADRTITLTGGTLELSLGTAKTEQQVLSALVVNNTAATAETPTTSIILNGAGQESLVRTLSSVSIAANNTLELQQKNQFGWNTIWNINDLSGEGNLTWIGDTTHWTASILRLTGDGSDYTGAVKLDWNKSDGGRQYQAYIEVCSNNAVNGGTVELDGVDANGVASLALNTENATMQGLIGNAHSHLFAGAAPTEIGNNNNSAHIDAALGSTANNTLTLAGGETYAYAGTVGTADETAHLNLAMIGEGSQTFSGVAHVGDVSVSSGTLALSHTDSKVYGNISVSGGALDFDGTYTLGTGQSLSIATATSEAASLAGLVLAGGEIIFDATALSADTAALSVGTLSLSEGTASQTITFANADELVSGRYMLAGNWTTPSGLSLASTGLNNGTATYTVENGALYMDYVSTLYYTWTGTTDSNWNYSAANWDTDAADADVAFVADKVAIFETDANVTVSEAVSASKLIVREGAQVSLSNLSGLTVSSIAVESGKLSITGSGTSATAYSVATGAELVFSGAADSAAASSALVNATGAGNLTLDGVDATWAYDNASDLTGKLTIRNATLTSDGFSGNVNNYKNKTTYDLSSFTSVELDGATVKFVGQNPTWRNVTVTSNGATLNIRDMDTNGAFNFSDTTTLNGALTLEMSSGLQSWKSQLNINKLTGSGDINVVGAGEYVRVKINSTSNYTGDIAVSGDKGRLILENGAATSYGSTGATVTLSGAASLWMNGIGALTLNSTLVVNGNSSLVNAQLNSAAVTRTLDKVTIADSQTLTLRNTPSDTAGSNANPSVTWIFNDLSGAGHLVWESFSSNSKTNQLVLKGDGSDFTGNITVNRSFDTSNGPYQTYVVLASDDAAKNSLITLNCTATSNEQNAKTSLAVNTTNAQVKGLASDEYAHLYAGAPLANWGSTAASSTANNTLTIAGGDTYAFAGTVGADNESAHLNLAMIGSGTQTFSGVAHVGDVSVSNGSLALSNASSVVHGDISVTGGSFTLGSRYTLGSGQVLSVFTEQAVTLGGIALAGGKMVFDASLLKLTSAETPTAALTLTGTATVGVGTTGGATVTLDFSKLSEALATGNYLLAAGDWSGAEAENVFTYKGSGNATLSATSTGLILKYTNDSVYTWVGGAVDGEGAADSAWASANWDLVADENASNNASWAIGKDAIFNTNAIVSVGDAVTAGTVFILDGAQVTLNGSGTLSVENLVVANGKLTLGGEDGKNWDGISGIVIKENGILQLEYGIGMNNSTDATDILLQGGKINLRNGGGTNHALHADITVDGAGTIAGSHFGEGTTVSGSITGTGTLTFAKELVDHGTNTMTISAPITDGVEGALALVIDGTKVKLTGTNTYTGGTTIGATGELQLGKNGNGSTSFIKGDVDVYGTLKFIDGDATGYGNSAQTISAINVYTGGTLNVESTANQTAAGLAINLQGGTMTGASGSNIDLFYGGGNKYATISALAADGATADTPTESTISGVQLGIRQRENVISVAEHARLSISSVIADRTGQGYGHNNPPSTPAIVTLNKTGLGELVLSGANTYTQGTIVEAGTLTLANGGALNSAVTVNEGATFKLLADTAAVSYAKAISGAGTVVKAGANTATLSGANTYTGATTVSGGTLELTGAVSLAAQSNIALANGTTLLLNATNESTMTLGNAISGTGTIHKKGAYETVLSGNVDVSSIEMHDGGDYRNTHVGTLSLVGATANAGLIHVAWGTLNIGGTDDRTTMLTVGRFETGDNSSTGDSDIIINAGSTLSVTGSSNDADYKTASVILGEWGSATNLTVAGKLLVPNAKAQVGNNTANITINNGGTMAVQGITHANNNETSNAINVTLQDGGTLILGSEGIDTAKTFTGTLGAGTVGMSAASTTIAEDVTLNSAVGTTFDTTQYAFATNAENVATDIVRGTEAGEMTISGNISSAEGVAAKMKVAGNGELTLNGNATLGGGLEVEQGAKMYVSSTASIESTADNAAATMEGALSIKQATDSEASSIKGTGDTATTMDNSLITISQGASLTVDNMIISESSRITGQTAATFAARTAGVTNLTATNTTVVLGSGNAEVAGQAATLAQNTLVSLDGTATKVQMAGDFTTLAVTSNALSSLTLNAGSSLTVDFSSLLADVDISTIDLIELSFADVSFDPADNITISGVLGDNRMMAYYLAPAETAVANVGSIYFATDSIPEPTTTTLSILALAALAARRRRR